jgi:hypothetical protein
VFSSWLFNLKNWSSGLPVLVHALKANTIFIT